LAERTIASKSVPTVAQCSRRISDLRVNPSSVPSKLVYFAYRAAILRVTF
jgi:hypothetical protein